MSGRLARIFGALYALWGFIFGVIVALVALAGAGMARRATSAMPGWFGGLFGVGAVIFLPICTASSERSAAALTAVFYNIIAGMVGGLQIETE